MKKPPERAAGGEVVTMSYPPGSKLYFENKTVPGAIVESVVQTHLGSVRVELIADPDPVVPIETLRKNYMDACAPNLPIGVDVIVSVRGPS